MLKFMISGLALGALVASGCKPASDSTVKSLDNFAAGKNLHRNVCVPPSETDKNDRLPYAKKIPVILDGSKATANGSKLKAELHETLTAIPKEFLATFAFTGVRFTISDDALKGCSSIYGTLTKSTLDLDSCHIMKLDASDPSVNIIIPSDTDSIRHLAVKSSGLAFSEALSRITTDGQGKVKLLEQKSNSQTDFERQLANSFLIDLIKSNNREIWANFVINNFSYDNADKLKKYFDNTPLKDQISSNNDVLAQLNFDSMESGRALLGQIFSNSWDSMYCNRTASFSDKRAIKAFFSKDTSTSEANVALKNTYKVMETIFPLTHTFFSSNEAVLKNLSKHIFSAAKKESPVSAAAEDASSGSGFNLGYFDTATVNSAADGFMRLSPGLQAAVADNNQDTLRYMQRGFQAIRGYNMGNPFRGMFTSTDSDMRSRAPEVLDRINAINQINAHPDFGNLPQAYRATPTSQPVNFREQFSRFVVGQDYVNYNRARTLNADQSVTNGNTWSAGAQANGSVNFGPGGVPTGGSAGGQLSGSYGGNFSQSNGFRGGTAGITLDNTALGSSYQRWLGTSEGRAYQQSQRPQPSSGGSGIMSSVSSMASAGSRYMFGGGTPSSGMTSSGSTSTRPASSGTTVRGGSSGTTVRPATSTSGSSSR